MKTKLLIVFAVVSFLTSAKAQEPVKWTAFGEVGGKGFFSANLGWALNEHNRFSFGLTLLDYETLEPDSLITHQWLSPGLMYYHLHGKGPHYFEMGAGFSLSPIYKWEFGENDHYLSLHGTLAYRYMKKDGLLFRAGIMPFYRVNWMLLPLPGISLGYSF